MNAQYNIYGIPEWMKADPSDMTGREANKYFDWFMNVMPLRLNQMSRITGVDLLSHPTQEEGVLAVLTELGRWMDESVRSITLDPVTMQEERDRTPEWYHPYMPTELLSAETTSYCIDIGMYFGNLLVANHPTLRWDLVRRPKSDADFHRPAIYGFIKNVNCAPARIMIVIAYKSLEKTPASIQLPQTYNVWSRFALTGVVSLQ